MSDPSRPTHIDLGSSRTFQAPRFPGTPPAELPPPKTGDAPPALSPLDAFAFQSHLLASRFDEDNGRRISRLPPFMVENELQKPRQGYFNASNSQSPVEGASSALPPRGPPVPAPSGNAPDFAKTSDRHRSYYPHIQNFDDAASIRSHDTSGTDKAPLESVSEEAQPRSRPRWVPDRSESPDSFYDAPSTTSTSRIDFAPGPPSKSSTNESLRSNSSLAPQSFGFPSISRSPRLPSIAPHPHAPPPPLRADSDDSDAKSIRSDANDFRLQARGPVANMKDRPRSPWSPSLHARRSPSVSSEISNPENSATTQPRRSINFSRPMSPANRVHRPSVESRPSFENSTRLLQIDAPDARPSIDVLSIQESLSDIPAGLSRPFPPEQFSHSAIDDETSSISRREAEQAEASASYTYARYALPRGRKVMSRTSMAAADWMASKIDWDQQSASGRDPGPAEEAGRREDSGTGISRSTTLEKEPIEEKPEPQSRPSTSKGFKGRFVEVMDDDDDMKPPGLPSGLSQPDLGIRIVPPTPAFETAASKSRSFDEVRPASDTLRKQKSNPAMSHSAASTPVDRHFPDLPTLRPKGTVSRSRAKSDARGHAAEVTETAIPLMPDQGTAEQHLAKGIASHEEGSLQKSTYHLRLAARGGHPTAMLLYALACRHGWGMRANQAEGLNWLRKAVDLSKVEVGNDRLLTGPNMDGVLAHADAAAKRAHKAQLALSIYELGISYMNGWGIATDKGLALRCFEIAGGWGDADALAEAGFCYAKGVGCKKDLHKAADFYRRAEAKGISMAGNSWIYKEKYMAREEDRDDRKGRSTEKDEKKSKRDKSRTRTFFGGKKKHPDLPS